MRTGGQSVFAKPHFTSSCKLSAVGLADDPASSRNVRPHEYLAPNPTDAIIVFPWVHNVNQNGRMIGRAPPRNPEPEIQHKIGKNACDSQFLPTTTASLFAGRSGTWCSRGEWRAATGERQMASVEQHVARETPTAVAVGESV